MAYAHPELQPYYRPDVIPKGGIPTAPLRINARFNGEIQLTRKGNWYSRFGDYRVYCKKIKKPIKSYTNHNGTHTHRGGWIYKTFYKGDLISRAEFDETVAFIDGCWGGAEDGTR